MSYPLPVTQKPLLLSPLFVFEWIHPSRLLKADRPRRSRCHKTSATMNISGAWRHTKNVEKLLAFVPSEQKSLPSHAETAGGRGKKKLRWRLQGLHLRKVLGTNPTPRQD